MKAGALKQGWTKPAATSVFRGAIFSVPSTTLWLIPMFYVAGAIILGIGLPRIENVFLASSTLSLSVTSAQSLLSAVASGTMALTGIVFAIGAVMVQFSAVAYSPRLAQVMRNRTLFHALGVFAATFIYALSTLAWIDREASTRVPLLSSIVVLILLIASMILFSLLVQHLGSLRITNVLHMIGGKGRVVIQDMFSRLDSETIQGFEEAVQLGSVTQTLNYIGEPRTIAKFDLDAIVEQAREAETVIVTRYAVGDTIVQNTPLFQVYGGGVRLSEQRLMRAIELARERTFEQDPKFAIRLLVDIAIKALSPAINDPTTAVQAIDQIEDLLGRLGQCELGTGKVKDANGVMRVVLPISNWDDYLMLAFDEIRQYGASSIQVMRRLRSALLGMMEALPSRARIEVVRHYLDHLDSMIKHSSFDEEDQAVAHKEDRQGLGVTRGMDRDASRPAAPPAECSGKVAECSEERALQD